MFKLRVRVGRGDNRGRRQKEHICTSQQALNVRRSFALCCIAYSGDRRPRQPLPGTGAEVDGYTCSKGRPMKAKDIGNLTEVGVAQGLRNSIPWMEGVKKGALMLFGLIRKDMKNTSRAIPRRKEG